MEKKTINALKFLGFSLGSFIILYLVSNFLFSNYFNILATQTSSLFLKGIGVENYILNNTTILAGNSIALISGLCSGLFEICLLSAFILGSFELKIRTRIKWMILAIITILIVNPIRIAISILFIGNNTAFAVNHDLLFRILTFSTIVVFYGVFYAFQKKKEKNKK